MDKLPKIGTAVLIMLGGKSECGRIVAIPEDEERPWDVRLHRHCPSAQIIKREPRDIYYDIESCMECNCHGGLAGR